MLRFRPLWGTRRRTREIRSFPDVGAAAPPQTAAMSTSLIELLALFLLLGLARLWVGGLARLWAIAPTAVHHPVHAIAQRRAH